MLQAHKKMVAKFGGRCRNCRKSISVGEVIYWKTANTLCENCGKSESGNDQISEPSKGREEIPVSNVNLPAGMMRENEYYFTIDWADFKEMMKDAAFNNRVKSLKKRHNESWITEHFDRSAFTGATRGQVKRWLTDGFQTDAIKGLSEFIPPVREKRRLQFLEEGDELLLDVAWSGGDNYFSEWTKRETIPGVAIEASVMFAGKVDASVVAAYNVWICKSAYSLEAAGVDCQITLDFPSRNLFNEDRRDRANGKLAHNIVRVKKENETSDFLSWSAMLSPASLRVFGFALGAVHADAIGKTVTRSFGTGIPECHEWKVSYDEDRRVIRIQNDYMGGHHFPEEKMTQQLREILKQLNSSSK